MPVIEDPHALSSRLIDRGIAPDQARAIAGALHETPSSWATEAGVANVGGEVVDLRSDMRSEFALVRSDMRSEFALVRSEMRSESALIRAEMAAMDARLSGRIDRFEERMAALPNIIMVRMGGLMVVLFGLAVSALRYLPPARP